MASGDEFWLLKALPKACVTPFPGEEKSLVETHRLLSGVDWGLCGGVAWRGGARLLLVGDGEGAGLAEEELCPSEYKLDVDW